MILMLPPHERPTARELAAQASGVDPWACPRCGCKAWRVVNSYMSDGKRRRQRACLNCHTPLITHEIPVPDGYRVQVVPKEE